jgi:multiple sugar transport system permease protein
MSQLFAPFALRGTMLPNRVMVSPMAQYSARRGQVTDWLLISVTSPEVPSSLHADQRNRVASLTSRGGRGTKGGMNNSAIQQRVPVVIRRQSLWRKLRVLVVPYMFVLPQLALFSVFMFFPLGYALFISFHNWDMVGEPDFIGAANFVRLVHDQVFWFALRNTLVYVAGTVPLSIGAGLLLANALNRPMRGRGIFRSIFFLPVVVSAVVTALAATWVFNDNYGLLNRLLIFLGLAPVNWLSSPAWSMISLILTTIWLRLGFCMTIYLAALQTIPSTLYEAARIDGASKLQLFFTVTIPMLRPTTLFLTIICVIYSFHVFDLIFVMTGGGPGYSTIVLVQYIYNMAFLTSEMGYACAIGMALFALILSVTILRWLISRRSEVSA